MFKAAFTLLDLLTGAVIYLILKERGEPTQRVLLYLWNPLILISFALGGHLDSLAIFLLTASVYFFLIKKSIRSFPLLALAVSSKLYPLVIFPFFVQRRLKKLPVLIFPGTVILVAFPFYIEAGNKMFQGLAAYADRWRFNDSLFFALEWIITKIDLAGISGALSGPLSITKGVIAVGYALTLAFFLIRKKEVSLLRISFWSIGLLLLLSPTFHFWYLTWLVPFLVFFPNRAWILLTGTIMLSQEVLAAYATVGVWEEKWWIRLIEFAPFYLLLAYDKFKGTSQNCFLCENERNCVRQGGEAK